MKSKFILGLAALFLTLTVAGSVSASELVFEGSIIQESYDASDTDLDTISVDYWQFTVNSPGTVTIDVLSWEKSPEDWSWVDVNGDGEDSFIDSYIHVFKGSLAAENIYASNDDGGANGRNDGTIRGNDSFLSQEFEAGDYIIAISSCGYPSEYFTVDEAVAGLNQKAIIPYSTGEGDHGDYRITMSGDISAVPIPATVWLLGSGIFGLSALRKRRFSA
jgi:hypothetical protein